MDLRENSNLPFSKLREMELDPVRNIAIQNPTAQPGSGKAVMNVHRNDIGELYGFSSNQGSKPAIKQASNDMFLNSRFSSKEIPSKTEQQHYYFNYGMTSEGTGRYVKNQSTEGVNIPDQIKYSGKHMNIRKRPEKAASIDMFEKNSIVYPFTSAFPASFPVGLRTSDKDVKKTAKSCSNVYPPNSVVSSKDKTTFLAY
jgi:hypothetical protein